MDEMTSCRPLENGRCDGCANHRVVIGYYDAPAATDDTPNTRYCRDCLRARGAHELLIDVLNRYEKTV